MSILVLLIIGLIPWKFCLDWLKLQWITKDEDTHAAKWFGPVFLQLTGKNVVLSLNLYYDYDEQNIYSPKPEVQLIQHISLQHAELINNN